MIGRSKKESQYNKCIHCKKNRTVDSFLCKKCSNPYLIDNVRSFLLNNGEDHLFIKTYSRKFKNINNNNSGTFWDKKFEVSDQIKNQDNMTQEKIKYITSLLPKKRIKILDLGIGQGYLEQELTKNRITYDTYGIDISSRSITRAKEKFVGNFLKGDIMLLSKYYKKNFFDVVVAVEVIEHIPHTKIFGLYKDVYSILKPHGKLIISTPLNEHLTETRPNPSAHLRQYAANILMKEFEYANFKVKNHKIFYAFRNFYVLKKLLARIFPKWWEPNNIVILAEKI